MSQAQFHTDYENDEIFWSFSRIKMIGVKTAEFIVAEREKNGSFDSITNFIHRIFKYKLKRYEHFDDTDNPEESKHVPVNARHVKNLVLAGCFDKLEGIDSVTGRYDILSRAAKALGFEISGQDFPAELIDKHYFWSMQQIAVSGIGSIDYRRTFDNHPAREKVKGRASYMTLRDALIMENEGKRIAVCATVIEVEELSYKDKETGDRVLFAKLKLQQNNDLIETVCWNDFYSEKRKEIAGLKDKIIILSAAIKYSDYSGANTLNTIKTSILEQV